MKIRHRGKEIEVQENLFDKVVRYVNPVQANRRLHARIIGAIAGGYIGARRDRRATSEWTTRSGDADADTLFDLPTLRDRSRDLERNNPLAGGAINTNCTNIVGTGIKLQARIDRDALGMTEEEADAWESNVEREWRLFAESKDCDVERTLNLYSQQELILRSCLVSGDVFVLLPHIERNGNPYGLKIQVVEADRVSNKDNIADSDMLSGGVEKDKNGAPVAYHIRDDHPGKMHGSFKGTWRVILAFGQKTGRRNVLHLFRKLRPGQTRGIPYLAPVIEPLKQLGNYTESELMASVISSMFTVFIKSDLGETDFAPMMPTAETGAKSSDEDIKLASGAIVGLAPGESIETANPGRPNAAFDPFIMAILRQVGVGLELPFEILIKHFTASYSAARAALLEAWKFFLSRRAWLSAEFCQMVYEAWMEEAVAIGRISAPGFFRDPIIRAAYLGSEWIGPAKGMINETDEVGAANERVNMGISTLAEETAQLTGGDWERKHRQRTKEQRMRVEAGLTIPAKTENSGSSQNQNQDMMDNGGRT